MENKQTAVNWLIKNLMLNGLIRLTQDQHSLYKELTEEAKAIEKQQIMDARQDGHNSTYIGCESGCGGQYCIDQSNEQYYNETYTNENR